MESLIPIAATIVALLVGAGFVVALAAMRPRKFTATADKPVPPCSPGAAPRAPAEPEFLPRLPDTRTAHLLTGDHRALFAALNAAAPDDLAVLPLVRLSDMLHVESCTTQPERYQERIRDSIHRITASLLLNCSIFSGALHPTRVDTNCLVRRRDWRKEAYPPVSDPLEHRDWAMGRKVFRPHSQPRSSKEWLQGMSSRCWSSSRWR